jgi:hypothetical protein
MSQWRSPLEPSNRVRRSLFSSSLVLAIRILVIVLCESQSAFAFPVNKVAAPPTVACTVALPEPSCQMVQPELTDFAVVSRNIERRLPDYYDPPINREPVNSPITRSPDSRTQGKALRYDS